MGLRRVVSVRGVRGWVVGVLLFLLTCAVYVPAMGRGGFAWDDDDYVTKNLLVQSGGEGLAGIWGSPEKSPQYYPVVFTTFWVEYHLWGLAPAGYHVVNVVLHGVSVVLVWRILVRLRVKGAVLAAALFAVHPVMVESVAWVTELKNVLSGVFYLGAMLLYLRFALREEEERREWGLYGGAVILFVLALLSKSVACSFPVVVVILLWYRRGRVGWREVGLLVPFFVLGVMAGVNTAMLERTRVGAVGSDWALTWGERVMIAGRAFWFYLETVVVPWKLTFIYPRWAVPAAGWWWVFPIGAVVAVVGSVALARRRAWGRGVAAGVLFFGVTIFPALGFTNIFPMRYTFVADHYQYLASLGWLVLIAAGLAAAGERVAVRWRWVGAGALVAGLGVLTIVQCGIYASERALWTDTVRKNPEAWPAYDNLGILETRAGAYGAAYAELERARALKPTGHVEVYMALGDWYFKQGRYGEARGPLEEALRQEGDPAFKGLAANMLGAVAVQAKDYRGAAGWFEESVKYSPRFAEAWLNLQQVEMLLGDYGRARAAGEEVVRLAE